MTNPNQDISIPWYNGVVRGHPVAIRASLGAASLDVLVGGSIFKVDLIDVVDEWLEKNEPAPCEEGGDDNDLE